VRVLIVDDDAMLRLLYRYSLEASGLEVAEAGDGETALSMLRGELPDAVLLDVGMPGISGFVVAERLAGDRRTRNVPLIFVTAEADDVSRSRGLGLARAYLTKPLDPATLAETISSVVMRAEGFEPPRA
jgi:DNA-binding response OmpR family regulator